MIRGPGLDLSGSEWDQVASFCEYGISTLKMKIIQSSGLLVPAYKTAQSRNRQGHNRNIHYHENLKPQMVRLDVR
jgi:hypothetical protein